MHDLIHINEALSGLPVDVKFISFEDVKNGILKDVDGGVLILKSASFDGEVYYHDGKLQMRRFNITELDTN